MPKRVLKKAVAKKVSAKATLAASIDKAGARGRGGEAARDVISNAQANVPCAVLRKRRKGPHTQRLHY